jgi:hypothetical protein
MSVNIVPTWAVQQFNTNVGLLVQQKQSRLEMAVTSKGGYKGESASVIDQVGPVEMQEVVTRFSPMGRVDASLDRRWVAPFDFQLPQLVDNFDKFKILLTDPMSWLVQGAAAAAKRKKDDRIINAFFTAAMTGKTGSIVTPFDAGQVVSVNTGGTDSPLNVAKLEEARRLFVANEVDLEEERIHVAMSSKDQKALRSEILLISMEYNEKPVFDDNGNITKWRGYDFHYSERAGLTTEATDDAAGSSRAVPMWVKSGMHLGIWEDISTSISQRNDLTGEPWQAYTKLSCNATRLEEKKVVKVWCGQ